MKSKVEIKLAIDEKEKGIWRFSAYLAPVPDRYKLTLNEGMTEEIYFSPENVILKREDKNPSGSLKDRGMAYLISRALSEGNDSFVLSSSGNAAISANAYCQKAGLKLKIFVSPNIEKGKLTVLRENKADIEINDRPLSSALNYAGNNRFYNLRPSVNQYGSEGYQTIAFEIILRNSDVSDIFIPVSSGVNLLGIFNGYKKIGIMPHIHVCQPAALCPIASEFDKNYSSEDLKLTGGLVAKKSPLKEKVIEAVRESGGFGWVIENEFLNKARQLLEKEQIITSYEGALTLSAMIKARKENWRMEKPLCLLTGKKYN